VGTTFADAANIPPAMTARANMLNFVVFIFVYVFSSRFILFGFSCWFPHSFGADYSRTGGMASTIIIGSIGLTNTEDRQKPSRFGTQDPSTVSASRSSFSEPPVFDSF
jgi:hypothetical protein